MFCLTVAMARLTRMIAATECTSKILSFAIICCSFGITRVEGGFEVICMPNGERMAKGTFVNDSMIKASEWLIREMQKLTS